MLERTPLAIVREVEKQGSLTAAAGVLCVTQSALSHSMKKLEQQLGTDIWLREGRSLRLTQAGQYLLAVAQRVLPQLDLAEERLRQFARGERGAPGASAWSAIPATSGCSRSSRPIWRAGPMGCGYGPGVRARVHHEQVLVVSSAHALAGADFVEAAQLAPEVLITYPVPMDRLDIYNQPHAGRHHAAPPEGHRDHGHHDEMVASGRGVAALPRWLVQEYAGKRDVVPVRLGAKGIAKQIFPGRARRTCRPTICRPSSSWRASRCRGAPCSGGLSLRQEVLRKRCSTPPAS
ncbi:Protein jagged-1 [Manis javanica]|nr:Protein jagged-1 [Manis javanica]